jgi:hypothetical protein
MVRLFGTTIDETLGVLAGSVGLGTPGGPPRQPTVWTTDRIKVLTRVAISLVLLFTGIYLVMRSDQQRQTAGASMISGVVGYWLR